MIQVVPVDEVRPSTYNPRTASPARLDLVRLSLSRFGWLLPIYATTDGEILSGHQRHYVATEMLGWTRVPVAWVESEMDLDKRQAVNVMFNRTTNDLRRDDNAGEDANLLVDNDDFVEAIRTLPELTEDSPPDELFPCLGAVEVPAKDLLDRESNTWDSDHGVIVTSRMTRLGVPLMPAVVTESGDVVNGRQRIAYAVKNGRDIGVVRIPDARAELAEKLLNKLSMDFSLEDRYADVLRYNSFRRARGRMKTLGSVMTWHLLARGRKQHSEAANRIKLDDARHREAWRKFYGTTVLDFGAGLLDKTEHLAGFADRADAFEPFFTGGRDVGVDPDGARWITAVFLEGVAEGVEYDSIFLNSIFNSVPFRMDREHILTILAALSGPRTRTFIACASTEGTRYGAVMDDEADVQLRDRARSTSVVGFALDYEERVFLTTYTEGKPKMQKFHTADELRDLCLTAFDSVRVGTDGQSLVFAECRKPKTVDPARLSAALEFEFDVPWPDDEHLDMADEAKAAFATRLGIDLP